MDMAAASSLVSVLFRFSFQKVLIGLIFFIITPCSSTVKFYFMLVCDV